MQAGTRDFGSHEQDLNRSLPQNLFCQILGQKFGASVLPGQIHSMLTRSFGNDASAKSLNYLGLLQQGMALMQVRNTPFPAAFSSALATVSRAFRKLILAIVARALCTLVTIIYPLLVRSRIGGAILCTSTSQWLHA